MNLGEYRHHFKSSLEGKYPTEEVISFFNWLCESYLFLKRAEIPLELKRSLTEEEQSLFDNALCQLEKDVPIQYILGETEFYGLKFRLTPDVLIPRPETEELVDWIIKETAPGKISILDIGTGSGCIAINLAKHFPDAKVFAIDISSKALAVAEENARLNQVQVDFFQVDVLNDAIPDKLWDVIVSNPPYVRNSEKEKMQANVLDYEPHTALFVTDEEPLLFYRKIAEISKTHLVPNGSLYFEINEAYGMEVIKLLEALAYNKVKLKKDFFGKDRMVSAVKPD
jgi:release factor glutamine methyltransferase